MDNSSYFSIVIPHFCRTYYLYDLIQSIHEHADMPFELIVHEDGSPDGSMDDIIEMQSKISTLIVNTNIGKNMGLAASANRCIKLATSKYILFVNNDCIMQKPCLKQYKAILDKDYVGLIAPIDDCKTTAEIANCDVKFGLRYGIGSGAVMAFRKNVWEEIGGFDEETNSGCADCPLMFKIQEHGYFRANSFIEGAFKNVDHIDNANKDSTMCRTEFDCCYPRLFKFDSFDAKCRSRLEKIEKLQKNIRNEDASINNMDYWWKYMHDIFSGTDLIDNIDWKLAEKHGQAKWKEQIENDRI